jgi:hypothetical protein
MDVQNVSKMDVHCTSLSTASSMDVQEVSLPTARSVDVQGIHFHRQHMEVQGVFIFIVSSMDVQGVPLFTTSNTGKEYTLHVHTDVQSVFLSTSSSMDVHWWRVYPFPPTVVKTCKMYHSPSLAVWTCKVCVSLSTFVKYSFNCRNAGLFGIRSVRYRNKQKCRCRNQPGTGPTYRMPECRCRCPAMLSTLKVFRISFHKENSLPREGRHQGKT